ncbi:type IV pilin protein [Candidatus Avelusimicrobium fimicolum]|jgi:prepilin-type N-terminal cleavage/methylation domain-containing protein|uniref:type IV pilin protein n=1 Tax=Candidatus Avelusimicrobium fimicolum TaxID=3416216 RepID=UPI003D0A1329
MKNVRMSRLGRLLRGWNKQFFSLSFPRNYRRGAFGELALSLLSFRGPHSGGNPESRNKTKSFSNKQTGSQVHAWDDNDNNGSRIKTLRDDGLTTHSCTPNVFYTTARGFTLIELLVVVLIIGILASVAVPQYTKAVEKSRAAGVIQKVKSLQNAVDMYLLANDWPTVQFTNLSGTSGRENLDISFKANATMKRSGLAVSSYMVFDDYYFYVVCERDVCYIIAEDNKPYKEQIVRASWYRYKNYTRYQPMDTWNRGTCKYKSDSSAGKAICEYFKQNSLLSNNNWEISAKS